MQLNKKTIIIGSIIIVGAAIAGFVIYKIVKKGKGTAGSELTEGETTELSSAEKEVVYVPTASETTSSPRALETSTDAVMKIGAKGQNVALLQTLLNYVYGSKMIVDGRYGNTTKQLARAAFGYTCMVGDCTIEPKDFQKLKLDALKKAGSAAKLTAMLKAYTPYISACKNFTKSTPIK